MNQIIPAGFGSVPSVFANQPIQDELSAGIQASFGLIGYRGKTWSLKYRGGETPLMRPDGDGPRGSIEVVIVRGAGHISKIWYEGTYVEGSNAAPDCYASNGVVPELNVKRRQAEACAICPRNQWGSRITPEGKSGKDCQDSKRLAIVPLDNIANEMFGGPMLLRVPAASLQDLASFGQKMQQLGFPTYAIGTKISFDPAVAYPKMVFSAIRALNEQEAMLIARMRTSPAVDRILAEAQELAGAATPQVTQQAINAAFEQPPMVHPQGQPAGQPPAFMPNGQPTGAVQGWTAPPAQNTTGHGTAQPTTGQASTPPAQTAGTTGVVLSPAATTHTPPTPPATTSHSAPPATQQSNGSMAAGGGAQDPFGGGAATAAAQHTTPVTPQGNGFGVPPTQQVADPFASAQPAAPPAAQQQQVTQQTSAPAASPFDGPTIDGEVVMPGAEQPGFAADFEARLAALLNT